MKPVFVQRDSRTRRKLLALRQDAQSDKAPRVTLRLQALLLSVAGLTPPQIAEVLHLHRTRVHAWVIRWNDYGVEGIKEGQRSGRPCELTAEPRPLFHDIVESGPVAHGLDPGVWTSPLLADVLQEEFGVHYHPGQVRKLLQQLGCSVQRPTTRLVRADPRKQNQWIRYTYPNLKKTPTLKPR